MALKLIFNCLHNELEAIEVFHFRSCTQSRLTLLAHRKIHITAHGALIHFAVGDAGIEDDGPELLQICVGFLCRADIRLRYYLNQWDTTAVAINEGTLAILMYQLAGILLNVYAVNANTLGIALFSLDIDIAVMTKGQI